MPATVEVEIEGRRLSLSNLDKVLYPEAGFTKADVIDYYRRIAPVLLPHLRGRVPTLVRAPGRAGGADLLREALPARPPPKWVEPPRWVGTAEKYDEAHRGFEGCSSTTCPR